MQLYMYINAFVTLYLFGALSIMVRDAPFILFFFFLLFFPAILFKSTFFAQIP